MIPFKISLTTTGREQGAVLDIGGRALTYACVRVCTYAHVQSNSTQTRRWATQPAAQTHCRLPLLRPPVQSNSTAIKRWAAKTLKLLQLLKT